MSSGNVAVSTVQKLAIECPIRKRTKTSVVIENPLGIDVVMTSNCKHPHVQVKDKIELKAHSETTIDVSFRPLLVADENSTLVLTSEELGDYIYDMILKGVATGSERGMTFNVPLGSKEIQSFRFMHYPAEKAVYECSFLNKVNDTHTPKHLVT